MLVAMLMTMLADTIPVSECTSLFSTITAVALGAQISFTPFSAFLMSFNPWISMWLGFALIMVGSLLVFLFPETKSLQHRASEQTHHAETLQDYPFSSLQPVLSLAFAKQIWNTVAHELRCIWQFILCDWIIMPLLLSYAMIGMMDYAAGEILLQYSTKRFGWKWETVSKGP
jgi:hypothetical protein